MKNTRLSLILSVISIVGVFSLWALWITGVFKLSVVSLDSFVGIIVALLAIIVTVVIGWQIINTIEIREKISELEQTHRIIIENDRLLNANSKNFVKVAHNLQAGLCDGSSDAYLNKGLYIEAFGSSHSALHQAILAGQSNLKNRIQQLQTIFGLIVNPSVVDFSKIKNQIELETKQIRETEAYRLYLSEDYDQIMNLFWKKMVYLGVIK